MKQLNKYFWRCITLLCISLLPFTSVYGQTDFIRDYTQEKPLVYEDAWDLWPYSFLNDNGEPDGFNIDLIRRLMQELGIPYVIKLKPQQEAFQDLKSGRSDLTLGLAVGFHDEYGLYGKNAITLFTQSVVTPKKQAVQIKNFRDLGKSGVRVIVNDGSLCHHLMIDYGWENNAVPKGDIREAIQQMSVDESGQIVWNTLSLKWLINRYHTDNLVLTPVNMPHGEYKFMSNNQQLLDLLDETYSKLYTAEEITPIQIKWFYPERQEAATPKWVWYLNIFAVVILLMAIVYVTIYWLQTRRIRKKSQKLNRRLALILQTSQVRIWTYDIAKQEFAWRNEKGQVAYTYSMEDFSHRYSKEDFQQLKSALDQLSSHQQHHKGADEEEITLQLKAKDIEGGDHELHDFVIVLSVLWRDKNGKPTVIVGTKKDVTREQKLQQREQEKQLRYWSIFYTPIVGVMLYDKDGYMVNINPKACEMFGCDSQEIITEHVHLNDFFECDFQNMCDADGFYATHIFDFSGLPAAQRRVKSVHRTTKCYCEYRMMTVYGDSNELLGIFVICRDITTTADSIDQLNVDIQQVENAKNTLSEYESGIRRVISDDSLRLVVYSPQLHTLTIYRENHQVLHALTQTRCMTLVNSSSQGVAMRSLNDMDTCVDREFSITINTVLRISGGRKLVLLFSLQPHYDKDGKVVEYRGILSDISTLHHMETSLAEEMAKVMEVEKTKNSFLKNMVQEIRKPLHTMVHHVSELSETTMTQDEPLLLKGIRENANKLLHFIDNVLYLSRLEAGMVEISHEPQDIAILFDSLCTRGWEGHQNDQTRYIVENPYEQLVVDLDVTNLGNAIAQLTANAAQHTASGMVKARCEFLGRRLVISIDDTGEGIPEAELRRIMETDAGSQLNTSGLGLAITRELVRQMEGKIEIISERGSGTTVYIMIRCRALAIKRKKQIELQ